MVDSTDGGPVRPSDHEGPVRPGDHEGLARPSADERPARRSAAHGTAGDGASGSADGGDGGAEDGAPDGGAEDLPGGPDGDADGPTHDPIDWDDPDDPSHHEHDLETVSVAVVTVSTSRTLDDDPAGDAVEAILEEAGHEIATRELVNDDYDGVQRSVDALVGRRDVDAVVTTGGTGVTPDDVTVEAVRPLLNKELPGFGELFRSLSREEIGTRVIATRAIAGVADGVPVFSLPGSVSAARLGTEALVVPEVPHLAGLARSPESSSEPGPQERRR